MNLFVAASTLGVFLLSWAVAPVDCSNFEQEITLNLEDKEQSNIKDDSENPALDVWLTKKIELNNQAGRKPAVLEKKIMKLKIKFIGNDGKERGLKMTSGSRMFVDKKEQLGFTFDGQTNQMPHDSFLNFWWKFEVIKKNTGRNFQNLKGKDTYVGYKHSRSGQVSPPSIGGPPGKFSDTQAAPDFVLDHTGQSLVAGRRNHDYIKDDKMVIFCGLDLKFQPRKTGSQAWNPKTVELRLYAKEISIFNPNKKEADGERRLNDDVEQCSEEDGTCGICEDDGGMMGEPHIMTWGGTWFDFQGECDLVLLQLPNFEPGVDLYIHVRTTIRYNYSFISSAAIRIGGDIDGDTLEVLSFGEYAVNGVVNADLDTLFGYPILYSHPNEKEYNFQIIVGKNEMISLNVFKDIVSVKLHIGGLDHNYEQSVGMMGTFGEGLMMARNGTTVLEDPNEFGQEWQVRDDEPMLFRTIRAPQYPHAQCILPPNDMVEARKKRRLGESNVTQDMAELACDHLWDANSKEACIFDVLSVGDLDIAKSNAY